MINKEANSLSNLAVVTGVGSGIGKAQALAFLEAGYSVIGLDKKLNLEAFESWLALKKFKAYQLDLTDEIAVDNLASRLIEDYDSIKVLCNTAGKLDRYSNLSETTYQTWKDICSSNLDSMFLLTKALLPLLLKEGASIINMSSIAGLTTGGGGIAYTSSKHGVIGFTKQLAFEYADQGLRVNALAPGAIETPMNATDFAGEGIIAEQVRQAIPLKRWAQPEEVAALSLFLASDQASYIQGTVIPLDGGWLIR